jgi:hypothetical protein
MTPEEADGVRLVGYDGSASLALAARFDLIFLNKTYRGDFLLIDGSQRIIGRDILNLLSLHLDGPRLV